MRVITNHVLSFFFVRSFVASCRFALQNRETHTFLEPFLRSVWGCRRATLVAKRQLDPALLRSSIRELSSSPQKPLAIHHIESSQHAGCTHEPLSPCSQAYRTRGPQYPRRPLRLLRRSSPRNGPVRLALHHPRARRERFCGRLVSFFFNSFSPSSCN